MSYTSVPAATFSGGLNIRDQADQLEPNQAYDLLNVTFTERGGVRSRPGFTELGPTTTLDGAVAISASTITVASTTGFDSAGTIAFGSNLSVSYTGKTATTFTGVTGVLAAAASGTSVGQALAARPDSMISYYTGSAWQVCVGAGNRLETRNTAGGIVGSAITTPTANPHFFTRFGGPTASFVYAANGTDGVRRWNGSAWQTAPTDFTWTLNTGTGTAPTPTGMFLGVTPWDNRLVNARFSSTTGGQNRSSVRFSDPYVPETWRGENWVDLTPGDGESIMGVAAFGAYLIVFKQTKFFVFYGTGTSATGTAEFQFRAVDAGVGMIAPGLCTVGPDGVYFVSQRGVYRTDGGVPQLISGVLDPIFLGNPPVLYSGSAINFGSIAKARMTALGTRIYLAVPTGANTYNDTMFVFDIAYGWWSRWNVSASALSTVEIVASTGRDVVFAFGGTSTPAKIARITDTSTTDNGAGITASIKMAYTDLGSLNNKTIRESQLWGTGTLRYGLARDYSGSRNAEQIAFGSKADVWAEPPTTDVWGDGTNPNDKWGAGQAANVYTSRNANRGLIFSIEIASTGDTVPPAWSVSKVVYRIREQRVPSVAQTDR